MQTITKQIPSYTKIYKSLALCCKNQNVKPNSVQPVFDDRENKNTIGFSNLPEKENGQYVFWVKNFAQQTN